MRRIRIGDDGIEIRVRPLPWPGSRRIVASSLTQVYVKRFSGRNGSTYEVCIRDDRNVDQRLIRLDDLHQALWLEQEIEQQLGIRDVLVDGAFRTDA